METNVKTPFRKKSVSGNDDTGDLIRLAASVTITRVEGNWVTFTHGGLRGELKVYSEPSVFGIKNGRVSKLLVRSADERDLDAIISYDRGWDRKPESPEHRALLNMIVKALA